MLNVVFQQRVCILVIVAIVEFLDGLDLFGIVIKGDLVEIWEIKYVRLSVSCYGVVELDYAAFLEFLAVFLSKDTCPA